ncbi:hypothetical protein RQ832_00300, partial [Roseomonas sp. DSM 102946]|nr:hypothetical protein [Roseomonas sp. DSM 102946]
VETYRILANLLKAAVIGMVAQASPETRQIVSLLVEQAGSEPPPAVWNHPEFMAGMLQQSQDLAQDLAKAIRSLDEPEF